MVVADVVKEEKLKKYKLESEEILKKMADVVLRVQQKVDKEKYKQITEKLKNYGK